MYSLGVDIGTTFVAAALTRDGKTEMVTLGDHSVATPAVVYLREDGSLLTGDVAQRRAVSNPDRIAKGFKRRLGDPTPVMLGGTSRPATTLIATLLREVLAKVTETEGTKPERVVLTHPANWGRFRRGLFEEASALAGLDSPPTVTEPAAAAAHYATRHELHDGDNLAVYDLGGGTFDAAVLRARAGGVEIVGTPEGIERLGGVDFDEAILAHVNYASGGALDELDPRDPQTVVAMAQLRHDCVLAKEALSMDIETVLPVFLPGRHFDVELTRSDFEDMIRAPIESTIGALTRTLRSASIEPAELSAVLLVGGSSRIPLVAEMVSAELGRPTLVDAHPKYAVALGAATLAALPVALRGADVPAHTAPTGNPVALPAEVPAAARLSGSGLTGDPVSLLADVPAAAHRAEAGVGTAAPWPPFGDAPTAGPPLAPGPQPPPRGVGPVGPFTAPGGGPMASASGAGPPPTPPRTPPSAGRRLDLRTAGVAVAVLLAVAALGTAIWSGLERHALAGPPSSAGPSVPGAPAPAPLSVSVPTPTLTATVATPAAPHAGAITPDGGFAYVTSTATNSVDIIDLGTDATVGSIPITEGPPQYVVFTPDGRFAYVSVYDEAHATGNAVVVVDTARHKEIAAVPAEKFPYAISVSPDGRQVWVPNHDVNIVSVISTATNTVVQRVSVAPNPHSVVFSGDGRRAYVANHAANLVTVIDTSTYAVLAQIPGGPSPHSVAVSPNGSRVYVVNYDGDSVSVVDPITNTVTATVPVQQEPQSVAFAPDGRHAYVVNNGSNSVSTIDTATNVVTGTIPVGQEPTNVFVARDGRHAYVTNTGSNNMSVLDTAS